MWITLWLFKCMKVVYWLVMFIHKCLQVKCKCYDYNDYWLWKHTIEHLHTDIKRCCDRLSKYLQITWQMQIIKRNHMIHILYAGQQNQMVIVSHDYREQYLSCQATTKSMNNTLALAFEWIILVLWFDISCLLFEPLEFNWYLYSLSHDSTNRNKFSR